MKPTAAEIDSGRPRTARAKTPPTGGQHEDAVDGARVVVEAGRQGDGDGHEALALAQGANLAGAEGGDDVEDGGGVDAVAGDGLAVDLDAQDPLDELHAAPSGKVPTIMAYR